MFLKLLFPTLLAATAIRAYPSPDLADAEGDFVLDDVQGEVEVFKRDSVLDARDLELADLHGVNLTEMYKHAHIKRDDGDHINIWVARSFAEDDEPDLSKRQSLRLADNVNFNYGRNSDWCKEHSRDDKTGPNAPFTGGVNHMFRWADTTNGAWYVNGGGAWHNLVIAGSNSGANTLYRVQRVTSGDNFYVGTKDVRNDVDWTKGKQRKFGSSWRASSTGRETCHGSRIRYQVIRTKYNV